MPVSFDQVSIKNTDSGLELRCDGDGVLVCGSSSSGSDDSDTSSYISSGHSDIPSEFSDIPSELSDIPSSQESISKSEQDSGGEQSLFDISSETSSITLSSQEILSYISETEEVSSEEKKSSSQVESASSSRGSSVSGEPSSEGSSDQGEPSSEGPSDQGESSYTEIPSADSEPEGSQPDIPEASDSEISGAECTSANACDTVECTACCAMQIRELYVEDLNGDPFSCPSTDREIIEHFLSESQISQYCIGNGDYCDFVALEETACFPIFTQPQGITAFLHFDVCCGCDKD